MVGKESEVQINQVLCTAHVAELELDASLCWASRTEDHSFPRGTVMGSAIVSEQSEWDVQGLICIGP